MNHHGTKEETVTTTTTIRSHKASNGIDILISNEQEIMEWALAKTNGNRADAEWEATEMQNNYDVWLMERTKYRFVFDVPLLPHNAITVVVEPKTGPMWPESKMSIRADRITTADAEHIAKCLTAITEYVEIAR